jgi:hypothetical protein
MIFDMITYTHMYSNKYYYTYMHIYIYIYISNIDELVDQIQHR